MQTMFDKAEEGTIFHQIYLQNMLPYGDPFFNDLAAVRQELLTDPTRAFLYPLVNKSVSILINPNFSLQETVLALGGTPCQIIRVWATSFPGLLTYGIAKKSPYKPFLFYQQLKLIENGALGALLDRWNEEEPVCNLSRVDSLGFEKILMAFLIVALGVVCAVSTFVVEFLTSQIMPSSSKAKKQMGDIFTGNYRQKAKKAKGNKQQKKAMEGTAQHLEKMLKGRDWNGESKEEFILQMELFLYQLKSA